MKTLIKTIALTAAIVAASSSALASDGKYSKVTSTAKTEKAQAEFGVGKSYLKGAVGVNFGQKAKHNSITSKSKRSMNYGVGVGTEVYENLRTELMLNFIPSHTYKIDKTIKGKVSIFNPMVNFHYDLANVSGVTPFVSAGLGLTSFSGTVLKGAAFSYMFGAGLGYEVAKDVVVEVAYAYENYGSRKAFNSKTKCKFSANSVTAGVRVKI